ncbi:NADH-cytochrome b5 reductase-like [Culicoides brevitarsis]|uniref:NADH-cytochrome b5 reductase-like n=1 Tax=Culicoides brevitarsis TaxID=469753 RepID=UPI00307B4E91
MSDKDDDDIECCGSGCTNCVLDRDLGTRTIPKEGCWNVITTNYSTFRLASIEKCTFNTYLLTFRWDDERLVRNFEEKSPILSISGGSHLMLRAPKDFSEGNFNEIFENFHENSLKTSKNENFQRKIVEKHDKTEEDVFISRPYTPILVDEVTCSFSILVKLEPHGLMSTYIQKLHVGALTEWKGTYNNLPQTSIKAADRIICFSHGVSIAPFYSLAQELTADESFEGAIELFACFKDMKNILLRDKLIELNGYWNFKSTIVLSRERHTSENCKKGCFCTGSHQKFNEKLIFGRLNEEFLKENVKICQNEKTVILICGSEDFVKSIFNAFDPQNGLEIHIL